ncbi:MAG: acyl carrier protein [Deltaproteobacteria bacterium]|nr:acyl carrier protein [Deltaproteobacteria bacterium]
MTDQGEIIQGIAQILAEHLAIESPITPETRLLGDLQLDSMDQLTLVTEIENRFRFCFNEGDEAGIETIADLARVVRDKLEATRDG